MELLYPAYLWLWRPTVLKQIELFAELDRYSYENIKKYQDEKITQLLLHAYNTTVYYREILPKCGVIAVDNGVQTVHLENFEKIPLLTKQIIRERGKDLLSSKKMEFKKNTSGGSTGEPIIIYQDTRYRSYRDAAMLHRYKELGMRLGESLLKVWGSERDIVKGTRTLKDRFLSFLKGEIFFNAYRMTEKKVADIIILQNNKKYRFWLSYVLPAEEIAKYLEANPTKFHSPRYIFTSTTVLTPEVKKRLEKTFNCTLINQYGSREVGGIAFSTPQTDELEIMMHTQKIEICDEKGKLLPDGEQGKVIVTPLYNWKMPLIRYQIEDVGVLHKQCEFPNGRTRDALTRILGREGDFFTTKNKGKVYGGFFTFVLYYRPWVHSFQVVQETLDRVNIRFIMSQGYTEIPQQDKDYIVHAGKKAMGDEVDIVFTQVDELELDSSGKFRYTKSLVK